MKYLVNAKLALVNDGENFLDSDIAGIISFKRTPGHKPAIMYREDDSVKNRIVFCVERAVYKNAVVVNGLRHSSRATRLDPSSRD
jgi:hypothetical protein